MKNPTLGQNKPQTKLVPALFQIAARADDPELSPLLKGALLLSPTSFADLMVNPEKLETMLKELAKKGKTSSAQSVRQRASEIPKARVSLKADWLSPK